MSRAQAYDVLKQGNHEEREFNRFYDFEQNSHVLNKANRLLVSRQQAVLQEQRFHLLFQTLGIAFHELNQPLTSLLGNIELLGFTRKTPEKLEENLSRIEQAGKRLSQTIKEIQKIRGQVSAPRVDLLKMAASGRERCPVLALVESDEDFENIKTALAHVPALDLCHAKTQVQALAAINGKSIRLALVDDPFLSVPGIGALRKMFHATPVVILAGDSTQSHVFEALESGIEDFIEKNRITGSSLLGVMHHAIQTAQMKTLLGAALDHLAEISHRDPSTGLLQGRFFKDAVEREMVKADRDGVSFFICKLRLSDFKKITALLGADKAEALVKDISKLIDQECKATCICRQEANAIAFIAPGRPTTASGQSQCAGLERTFTQYLKMSLPSAANPRVDVKTAWYTPQTWCSSNELIQEIA